MRTSFKSSGDLIVDRRFEYGQVFFREGDYAAAIDLFEQAIARSGENGFPHHEAIAKELCAKFHLARNHVTISKVYLTEARNAYAV